MATLALAACATTPVTQTTAATTQSALRNRPRRSAVRQALERAAESAQRCVSPANSPVEVQGAFAGETGRFTAERVLPVTLDQAQRACVQRAFGEASVPAFRNAQHAAIYTFTSAPHAASSGDWDVDPHAVGDALRARREDIHSCYQTQLDRDPTLRMLVGVQFTILASGSVRGDTQHWIGELTGDAERAHDVGRCLERLVQTLTFQLRPGSQGADFRYPFSFRSQSAATPGPAPR